MGLQIWLPLNGNLNNYGLSLPFIENHGAQIYDYGKIGKCYKYANSYTVISSCLPENPTEFSICAWVCLLPNFNKNNGCHLVSIGNNLRICIAKDTRFVQIITHNASRNSGSNALSSSIEENIWYHIAVTYKSGEIAIYINGEKDTIHTISQLTGIAENIYFSIGSYGNEYSNALINDYRIYNDCLSPRQVKEISKGLVCHYPLGEIDGKIGGRNLIKNGKGNVKAGFFKNFPTVTDEYGEFTLKSKKTYAAIDLGGGFVYGCRDYIVGEKYTWSYDIMYTAWNFPTGSNRAEFWMGQRYTNAPSGETATGVWRGVTQHNLPVVGQNGCELNKWYHIKQTVTIPQQASSNVGQRFVIQFYNSNANVEASFTARIKNVKLEKSSTATPWTPASEDDASFYDNVIYDTSGYCNNGSVSGDILWDTNTPRYKGAYDFNGTGYIKNNNFNVYFKEFTISYWIKVPENIPSQHFAWGTFNSWTGNGVGSWRDVNATDCGYSTILRSDAENNYGSFNRVSLLSHTNTWAFLSFIYTGTTLKTYVNGKLYGNIVTYGSNGSVHMPVVYLGNSLFNNSPSSETDECSMVDFRIYATALDNQTIEELYKVGASVDSSGNLYAYDFNEN